MSENTGTSLTSWLINAGGGQDPSWATSICRTMGALIGLAALYHNGPNDLFGDWNDEIAIVVHAAFFAFSLQLLIKLAKWMVDQGRHRKRVAKARSWWTKLSKDQIALLDEFVTEGVKAKKCPYTDVTASLLHLGLLVDLDPKPKENHRNMFCRIDSNIWAYLTDSDLHSEQEEARDLAGEQHESLRLLDELKKRLEDHREAFVKAATEPSPDKGGTGQRAWVAVSNLVFDMGWDPSMETPRSLYDIEAAVRRDMEEKP